ncbi:MAG: Gfo/Idh/MocA family oxidoreductase, partial [Planctomycetales bacterium]|nr:Gfo/Idh/MocA family oxidoreductase [Planctomycetales bacterium]
MSHVASHSTRTTLPRIAVVGCGAAATEFCFPALVQYPGFRHSVVAVDKNDSQAQAVATQFGLENHCTDIQRLPFAVDAAIVMTPHHLHAEQSIHFLRRSVPVFVEKPLGMSADEVTRMVDVAESNATTLMVNNCRRLFPAYRRVQELLQSGELGAIQKITISDGSPFDWNSVSGFYLR